MEHRCRRISWRVQLRVLNTLLPAPVVPQVSDVTAVLLRASGLPFVLEPRGTINVKGKGGPTFRACPRVPMR